MSPAPPDARALADRLRDASERGERVEVLGRGTHGRAGRPEPADVTLSTESLAGVIDYVPEDLTITVRAGTPTDELVARLADRGQCWPQVDSGAGGTVGGLLATAASGRSRLGFGPVRDSVLRVVLATGDGRLVAGGGTTVKGVAGYDLPRLAVGAHGTLGVITEVTLKLWPRPPGDGWFRVRGTLDERLAAADRLRRLAPRPASVLVRRDGVFVRIVGPPADVVPPEPGFELCQEPPDLRPPGLLEAGVSPGRLGEAVRDLDAAGLGYEALAGVGAIRIVVDSRRQMRAARDAAEAVGGHAVLRDGPPRLRVDPWGAPPAGLDVMRRLRVAFDPAGILNRGRFVGEGR